MVMGRWPKRRPPSAEAIHGSSTVGGTDSGLAVKRSCTTLGNGHAACALLQMAKQLPIFERVGLPKTALHSGVDHEFGPALSVA